MGNNGNPDGRLGRVEITERWLDQYQLAAGVPGLSSGTPGSAASA